MTLPPGSSYGERTALEADFGAVVGDGMGNADVFPIYLASCPEQDGLHLCAKDQLLTPRLHCVGRTDNPLFVDGVDVWPSAVKDVVASMRPHTTGAIQIMLAEALPRWEMKAQLVRGMRQR